MKDEPMIQPKPSPLTAEITEAWSRAEHFVELAQFGKARATYGWILAALKLQRTFKDCGKSDDDLDFRLQKLQLRVRSALAELDRLEGRYDAAERALRLIIAKLQTFGDRSQRDLAAAKINLGVVLKYQGKYAQAEACYLEAIRILRIDEQTEPLDWQLLYNLGGIAHAQQQYEKGERFARRALSAAEKALGLRHPAVAVAMSNLAANLEGLGRDDEAERLYVKSVEVLQRVYGPWHRDIGMNFNNLAALAQRRGDLSRAVALYCRAIRIKRKCLGSRHPDLATTLNNLASLYCRQGKASQATQLLQQAYETLATAVPADHPKVLAVQAHLRKAANKSFVGSAACAASRIQHVPSAV